MMKIKNKFKIVWLTAAAVLFILIVAMSVPSVAMAEEQSAAADGDGIAKVINVTDGSYRLNEDEYSSEDGELVIDGGYLYTLEAGREYVFRVVTADGEYDVTVETDFTAPVLTAGSESFVRGDEVSFTLSENVLIYDVQVDGRTVEYTREGNKIILSPQAFSQMTTGEHTVKLFTSKGRPSLGFTLEGQPDDIWQEIVPINYTWVIIDMVIFGGAILAFVTFVVIRKIQKRRLKAK